MSAQRDGAWVKTATAEEVAAAVEQGELNDYMDSVDRPTATAPAVRDGQRSESWLKAATSDQIDAARDAGELDDMLGIVRNEAGNAVDSKGKVIGS
jgi:hypothetical protein